MKEETKGIGWGQRGGIRITPTCPHCRRPSTALVSGKCWDCAVPRKLSNEGLALVNEYIRDQQEAELLARRLFHAQA